MTLTQPHVTDVPANLVEALTVDAGKAAAYRTDPYFRAGALAVVEPTILLRRTLIVLKPDAAAGRRIGAVLAATARAGFSVVAARRFRFTPLLTRELWRYQFNIASADRARVVDLLLPASDSLALVLDDPTWTPGALPAACRFGDVKGPADPRLRRPEHLRSLLAAPTTLFNFVHTADEPADALREAALLDVAAGLDLVATALLAEAPAPVPPAELAAAVAEVEQQAPEHDLDAGAAGRRILARPELAALPVRPDGQPDWRDVLAAGPVTTEMRWDLLSLATAQIECNVAGIEPLLPSIKAADWTRAGRVRTEGEPACRRPI